MTLAFGEKGSQNRRYRTRRETPEAQYLDRTRSVGMGRRKPARVTEDENVRPQGPGKASRLQPLRSLTTSRGSDRRQFRRLRRVQVGPGLLPLRRLAVAHRLLEITRLQFAPERLPPAVDRHLERRAH